MFQKIANVLSIISFIMVASMSGGTYFAYKYFTSEQFKSKMMNEILENVSEILAQCVLEQNAISNKVSFDRLDDLEKSGYASMFPTDIDDDDLLN